MSEPPTLLDYQRLLRKATVPHLPACKTEKSAEDDDPEWGREAKALYRAGWDYKLRNARRRIWCQDETDPWCSWYSEEIAYTMIETKEVLP